MLNRSCFFAAESIGSSACRRFKTVWGLFFALMVGVFLFTAIPAVEAQPRGLSTYESRAYKIHTNLTREEALEYGVHMDLIYKEYAKRFATLRGEGRSKQNLYLLRTRRDYIEAMAAFGIRAEASGGMFFWGAGCVGSVDVGRGAHPRSGVLHASARRVSPVCSRQDG